MTLYTPSTCHILICKCLDGSVIIITINYNRCRWDWASDQIEFTDDNEYLITFEKKKTWDVRWCCSLSSWLEWKSLRPSLVDLYTSYWILVWQLDDFQRSFRESFGDSFNEFRRTVWHWVNLIEGGQILRPNLLRSRKTLLRVPDIGISSHFRIYSHSLQRVEMFRYPGFGYISYSEMPGQFR